MTCSMLSTSRVLKQSSKLSLLSPSLTHCYLPYVRHLDRLISNSSLFSHNPSYICVASLSVTQNWHLFFTSLRNFKGKSFTTQTLPDEAVLADVALNEIVSIIERGTLSGQDLCNSIERLCRFGNCSVMAKLLQILHDKHLFLSSDAYNILLASASEKSDIKLSVEIFKDLLISSGILSSKSYFNLAKAFTNTDDRILLPEFVRDISELTCAKGALVMNRIIFAFAECRQIDKALILFDLMKSTNCKPDLITYNTILGILGRAGRVDDMLNEFASMKEANITQDVVSYNTLLNFLQKFGRIDLCLVYLRKMDENWIVPDLRTYTALIEIFGRSGNVEESLRIFDVMKVRQVRPSIYIYRSLISNLKKMGRLEDAATLWDEMNLSLSNLVGPKDFKRKNKGRIQNR